MNKYSNLRDLVNKIDQMTDGPYEKQNISIMYQKYKSDRNIWSTSFTGRGIDIIQAPGWVIDKLRIRDPYLGYNINQLLTKKICYYFQYMITCQNINV